MATTFRQVLNRVLRSVGEDEVDGAETTLTDSYHLLVATFVNQIKDEIEAAHNWRAMRQTHSAIVPIGQYLGPITNATDLSRLARAKAPDGYAAIVYDVTDAAQPYRLFEREANDLDTMIITDPLTSGIPSDFTIVSDADGTLSIRVYPKPTAQRTITIIMFTPQAYLTEADLDTVVKIPSQALVLGSIWYALEERGEELGTNSMFTEERWRKALDDQISLDSAEQGNYDLVPV